MPSASITVVGLGPGPVEWVTQAARDALLAPNARVFVRTAAHPAIPHLLAGTPYESLDALYERSASLDDLHAAMAERLTAAGTNTVLAVPGDGALGEAVLTRLAEHGLQVRIVPGVPLGAGALAAAGIAAPEGAQSVDATSLGGSGIHLAVELNPRWHAVVTGIYNRAVASDVKLALERVYPLEHLATVVRHPGLPDQQVAHLPLVDLDRGQVDLDHLTHLVLPPVPTMVPTGSAHGLRAVVARLRAPEIGCPWDLEQTHETLIPYMIEEAYEAVDAIQDGHPGALADELGDVLLQVALHAEVADQSGEFDWNDVVRAICRKLIYRHPHVFGDVTVSGASDVVRNWDVLKAAERGTEPPPESALDGIPKSLPALKQAAELGRKARKSGFDWSTRDGALAKAREEFDELLAATSLAEQREELGDLLWMLANLAMRDGIDPEEALRAASRKFTVRFHILEQIARERGWKGFAGHTDADLLDAWQEAKQRA